MNLMELPKFYIGTDIVEVERINRSLVSIGKRFKDRLFTISEQKYCDLKSSPSIHYSGRFAAKESIIKALKSSGYEEAISLKSIEILPSDSGAPVVFLHFKLEGECKVSISHTDLYATAMALYIQK